MSGFLLEEQLMNQVKEFTTPKTIYEHVFTICIIFWVPVAILTEIEMLRLFLFCLSIIMIILSFIERVTKKEMPISRSSSNLIKFFIATLFVGIWGKQIQIEWIEDFITDFAYYEIEKLVGIIAIVIVGFFLASNFDALLNNDPIGYFLSLFRGVWASGLLLLIALGLNYADFVADIYAFNNTDSLLAGVLICQIIGNQAPPKSILPITPSTNILQASGVIPSAPGFGTGTRIERLRDSIFFAGLTAILMHLLNWVEEEFWLEIGLIAIVGFFILMFASFQEQKSIRERIESSMDQIRQSAVFQEMQTSTTEALDKLSLDDSSIYLKDALEVVQPTKILKNKLNLKPGTALIPIAESASSVTCQ
ncbi:MAG: hypothetical protein ACFFCQ_17475, partial [Promethearchaeota archaeon]